MEKSQNINANEFSIFHQNQPELKLEIGSIIHFDKNGSPEQISLHKLVKIIQSRYITEYENYGLKICWKVTGYQTSPLN